MPNGRGFPHPHTFAGRNQEGHPAVGFYFADYLNQADDPDRR
jgi:hypothetical protein